MKSKKQTKKMRLGKVTIARLNQYEAAKVQGGAPPTYWCGSGTCDDTCQTIGCYSITNSCC